MFKKFIAPTLYTAIQYGLIDDWDAFKAIMMRLFSNLIKNKIEFAVLIFEAVGTTKQFREKLTTFFFDEIGVIGFFCFPRAVLALYAVGRTKGIVILSDYHCTQIVPVYDGLLSMHSEGIKKINIGRREILRYIEVNEEKLNEKNDAFDIMYDPKLCGDEFKEYKGIHHYVYESMNNYMVENRWYDYYSNMVLSGINTMDFDDIDTSNEKAWGNRLDKEVFENTNVPELIKGFGLKTVARSDRAYSVWLGGSIISSLRTFAEIWMTREDYKMKGASCIHKKMN